MATGHLSTFKIERHIGSGGIADVYKGVPVAGGDPVAIKVLSSKGRKGGSGSEALVREMVAAAKLNHPGIVEIFDFGTLPAAVTVEGREVPAGSAFIVMELVEGRALSTAPRTWAAQRGLILQLLDALAHAHARGVLHRDIKPSNLLLTGGPRPRLKLSDFGVARAFREFAPSRSGNISGTPRYMAPEQFTGEWRLEGPWTDLYAVGCVVHHLVTGKPPFKGESVADLLSEKVKGSPPDPVGPGLPADLGAWLSSLLAVSPEARFSRAADAAHALLQLSAPEEVRALDGLVREEGTATVLLPIRVTLPTLEGALNPDSQSLMPSLKVALGESGDGTEARSVRPPVPRDWRRAVGSTKERRGLGLGVFGWKAVPLVGRDAERDVLWSGLRRVIETGKPALVLVDGESGVGKSRLAQWLGERAEELGAATWLKASHSPIHGLDSGVAAMFQRHFKLQGLSRTKVFHGLWKQWRAAGAGAEAIFECSAVASLLAPEAVEGDVGLPPVTLTHLSQRDAAFAEQLGWMARERAVVLHLDDVDFGADSLRLARFLLDEAPRDRPLPVLVVGTLRRSALPNRPLESDLIAELSGRAEVGVVSLSPLSAEAQEAQIRRLLGLSPSLASEMVARAGGSPLFAVQLVEEMIGRGALLESASGYVLDERHRDGIPPTNEALWRGRIDRALAPLGSEEASRAWSALELAAAIGEQIPEAEWWAVCAKAGVRVPSEMRQSLAEAGLIETDREHWAFVHGMVRDAVVDIARAGGRWRQCHSLCADTIADWPVTPNNRRRLIEHLGLAQRPEEAVEPLIRQTEHLLEMGDYDRMRLRLGDLEETMDKAGVPAGAAHRARACNLEGHLLVELGQYAPARGLLSRAETLARACGEPELLGRVLCSRAVAALIEGQFAEGLSLMPEMVACLEAAGDKVGLSSALRAQAWLLLSTGEMVAAEASLDRAAAVLEGLGEATKLGKILYDLAVVAHLSGDLDRAEALLDEGQPRIEAAGLRVTHADCINLRGEMARASGQFDAAEKHYALALAIYARTGSANRHIAAENLARIDLAKARHGRARERFVALLDRRGIPTGGRARMLGALVLCAVRLGEPRAVESALKMLGELLESVDPAERDLALDLEAAARGFEGDPRLHGRLWAMAVDRWSRLGEDERAAQLSREATIG